MTWKSFDVDSWEEKRVTWDGPEASVGQLCARSLREAMPTSHAETVRLVGFSMGAQVAASCAESLHAETPHHPAVPTRLTLIDPYFQSFVKGGHLLCYGYGLDYKRTTRLVVRAVKSLWEKGVPTELYKGSAVTEVSAWGFNPALEIETISTTVYWDTGYCGIGLLSLACRHEACVPLYFLQKEKGVAKIESNDSVVGKCGVPGPTCTDSEIVQLMSLENTIIANDKKRYIWKQVRGGGTWILDDDMYRRELSDVPTDVKLPAVKHVSRQGAKAPTVSPHPANINFRLHAVSQPAGTSVDDSQTARHSVTMPILLIALGGGCLCCALVAFGIFMARLRRKGSESRAWSDDERDMSRNVIKTSNGSRQSSFWESDDEELQTSRACCPNFFKLNREYTGSGSDGDFSSGLSIRSREYTE